MNDTGFFVSRIKEVKLFFIIFYVVGIAGLVWPFSFPLFVNLIPFALLLSFTGLAIFHPDKTIKKPMYIFAAVFIVGFIIEAIGVKTGLIFGDYTYGNSLGPKLFATPVIIGLNWLFLVYTTASVFEKTNFPAGFKVVFASAMMLLYDVVLEQLAPFLDLWHWDGGRVPFKNYLVWFVIALVFHAVFKVAHVKTTNKLSALLWLCQFMFFLILYFIFI